MNNKLGFSAGILNAVLGAVLFIDAILIAVMAFVCLLLSFSLFFMAAIPAFFATGFLCIVAFVAAAANVATGAGAIITSINGGKISSVFSTVSLIVDVAVIPANITAMACGAYLLLTEVSGLAILIFLIAAVAVMLAFASLILNIVVLTRTKTVKQTEI